ncbi:MAG: 6,7-dimethyl-8-ribityllumazine synthase [Gammaproteobacteria bacterium]|nr:6,7-dimethyl-8-ribityllumazine synthase [Gammaproteobacteria bacterium]
MSTLCVNNLTECALSFLKEQAKNINIAIVCSRFNDHITEPLLQSTMDRLLALGVTEAQINLTQVPGAIEIPLAAQKEARSKRFQAVIVLGAVIRGDTPHYDYVCQQVNAGCLRVSLDEHIPVIFGVLTTDNEAQASARVSHGVYYAESAIEMMAIMAR